MTDEHISVVKLKRVVSASGLTEQEVVCCLLYWMTQSTDRTNIDWPWEVDGITQTHWLVCKFTTLEIK